MTKRIIAILMALTVSASGIACAATSFGKAPAGVSGERAKMIARRAAIVGMYRETGGKAVKILSERWDGRIYEIEF